ncbi:hypothetical protein BASA81_002865 [Batrachochytrium salamandrivorans]|nr:hypothetical protein BASA81_002865 [Batrachochytrium salamandrivorans]
MNVAILERSHIGTGQLILRHQKSLLCGIRMLLAVMEILQQTKDALPLVLLLILLAPLIKRGCISRTLGEGFTSLVSFYTPEAIFELIAAGSSYRQFYRSLEDGPHNGVHAGIGGTMNLLTVSANGIQGWQTPIRESYEWPKGSSIRDNEAVRCIGIADWTVAMMINTTSGDPL